MIKLLMLEIVQFVEDGKKEKISKGLTFFWKFGLAFMGPVVAGIVGLKKFQYDI
ncbi:MAG: hypothetical protein R2850_06100 [Bacteroidia bacterium]